MVGIVTGSVVPAFDNPEETRTKLGRKFGALIDWDKVKSQGAEDRGKPKDELIDAKGRATRALIDAQTVLALPGPETAYAPSWHKATFRIPLGMRWSHYEARRDEAAAIWVREMAKEGYDLCADSRIEARPGVYPAVDLHSGLRLLGEREVILMARFVWRTPLLYTWEIPQDWFGPQS